MQFKKYVNEFTKYGYILKLCATEFNFIIATKAYIDVVYCIKKLEL